MTWFRVDDQLHDHRKAALAGAEAMGLWVLCGSWCGDNIDTVGFVPERVAARFVRSSRRVAAKLVAASLWEESEFMGEKGWRFCHWAEFQLTPEDKAKDNQKARDRMRKLRADRKASSSEVRANTERSSPDVLDPTPIPIPEPVVPTELQPQASPSVTRAKRLPQDWQPNGDLVAWQREEFPHVDGRRETEKFRDHWHSKTERRVDWNLTWRNWIRKAAEMAPRAGLRPESWPVARSTTDQRVTAGRDLTARYLAEESNNHLELT